MPHEAARSQISIICRYESIGAGSGTENLLRFPGISSRKSAPAGQNSFGFPVFFRIYSAQWFLFATATPMASATKEAR